MIHRTLEHVDDDKAMAARMLGISVKTLNRKLKQYSRPEACMEEPSELLEVMESERNRGR